MRSPKIHCLGFNFMLELEGAIAGYFTECSGIGSEHEIIEHKVVDKAGSRNHPQNPRPSQMARISRLKRGITSDLKIWEWRDQLVQGKAKEARKNMHDHHAQPRLQTGCHLAFCQCLAFQSNRPQPQVRLAMRLGLKKSPSFTKACIARNKHRLRDEPDYLAGVICNVSTPAGRPISIRKDNHELAD